MLRRLKQRILEEALRRRRRRWAPAALAGAILPLALAACGAREAVVRAQDPPPAPAVSAAPAPVSATAGELLGNTGQYDGKLVTAAGEVNALVATKGFTIGGDDFLPPGELLVITPNGFPPVPERTGGGSLGQTDIVQVTGTLRTFRGAEMGATLGENADADHYAHWEGKPVLVASQLLVTPRDKGGTVAGPETPLTDLAAILTPTDREALLGKRVQLAGVKIQQAVADRAFWIGTGPTRRLFVALNDEVAPGIPADTTRLDLRSGQTVSIAGVLTRTPFADVTRRRWGLSSEEAAPVAEETLFLAAESVQLQQR